jgi:AraC-like DNA-binding protein
MGARILQRGAISAIDYRCDVRPGDKPFPEVHGSMSVTYVRSGSFGYRARGKAYDLVTGSVLIGNAGDEFVCTHDFMHGDECLSFHIDNATAEEIGPAEFWQSACLPPLAQTAVFGELAQAAAEPRSHIGLDEAALLFAHRAASLIASKQREIRVGERDRRRAIEASAWIDARCDEDVSLAACSAHSGLSPFHFLRIFTRVVGVTPHQYLIRSRLRRAASALAVADRSVTEVALASGFNDLANFARAFRRAAAITPTAYRNFCKVR